MDDKASPQLRAAMLQMVDNQLRDLEPPETKETYDRLRSEGHSDKEARRLIAAVLSSEMFTMLKEQKEYNHQRYVRMLRKLPKMPWE